MVKGWGLGSNPTHHGDLMTTEERAWLAGIIDGEGSIYASVEKRGYIQSALCVVMTHKPTIERICRITGSDGPKPNSSTPSNKLKTWRWTLKAQRAAALLQEVLPHLVTKREQAEVFIQLMSMRSCSRPNNDKPTQFALVQKLRDAKANGTEMLCTQC